MVDDAAIRSVVVALLASRAPTASICPSEVARALVADAAGWRVLMPEVRRIAADLAEDARLRITQGDRIVTPSDAADVVGPVRLRRGPRFNGSH